MDIVPRNHVYHSGFLVSTGRESIRFVKLLLLIIHFEILLRSGQWTMQRLHLQRIRRQLQQFPFEERVRDVL